MEQVERMVTFFKNNNQILNCREPQTGNSPLHWAAKLGHFVSFLT